MKTWEGRLRRPRTHETIRTDAKKLLDQLSITGPPIPIERIAKAMKAQVQRVPFDGELAGMLIRKNNQRIVGVNSRDPAQRQRFTIAHELGHLLYHKGEVHVDRKLQINRRDERSSLAIDPEEIEANRFAAEILMPFEMVIADLKAQPIDIEGGSDRIEALAKRYGVSVQAMTHRITNLMGF